jgi:predicted dehydrogenase
MRVLIVGAGPIGTEYIRICRDQALGCVVVTRTAETAAAVADAFDDVEVHHGGLSAYLAAHTPPPTAIIATPVRTLARMTELLIHAGVTSLLVEKPCCLSASAARRVATTAAEHAADVWVAYNRRHYASVQRARRYIVADGGVSSVWVEITEATDRIDPTGHPAAVLRRWGIANTSHVLDLAFDLAGPPTRLRAEQHGSAVPWHPAGSVFMGTGRTADGVPIAYTVTGGHRGDGDWR